MAWTLAHNLLVIRNTVKTCYPGIAVGTVGNLAHQAEESDHNPDSRGIVHADDLMFETDTAFHAGAPATLAWLLLPDVRVSLEYVIHDRKIYSRSSDWKPRAYTGSDPHTNHIHVSGKHGSTGKNSATGTGYDVAAEHMTPPGSPEDDMDLTLANTQAIADKVLNRDSGVLPSLPGDPASAGKSVSLATRVNVDAARLIRIETAVSALTTIVKGQLADAIAAAVVKSLPAGGATAAQVQAAADAGVSDAIGRLTVSVDVAPVVDPDAQSTA